MLEKIDYRKIFSSIGASIGILVVGTVVLILAIFGIISLVSRVEDNPPPAGEITQPDFSQPQPVRSETATITNLTNPGSTKVSAEIADTPEERAVGLMHRTSLSETSGMLFVFETSQQLNFWMKNTFIPLDIIFIDANKRIINIESNAVPQQLSPTYDSQGKAKYALEVNAGFAEQNNYSEGDYLSIEFNQ